MLPTCDKATFCAYFLAAFGAALGWGLGNFLVIQISRMIVGAW